MATKTPPDKFKTEFVDSDSLDPKDLIETDEDGNEELTELGEEEADDPEASADELAAIGLEWDGDPDSPIAELDAD